MSIVDTLALESQLYQLISRLSRYPLNPRTADIGEPFVIDQTLGIMGVEVNPYPQFGLDESFTVKWRRRYLPRARAARNIIYRFNPVDVDNGRAEDIVHESLGIETAGLTLTDTVQDTVRTIHIDAGDHWFVRGEVSLVIRKDSRIEPQVVVEVGPAELVYGNRQAGFYGEVPTSDLTDINTLVRLTGIQNVNVDRNEVTWLKCGSEGEIIYVAQTPVGHVGWDHLADAGCVEGQKQITLDGHRYQVRLLTGSRYNPSRIDDAGNGSITEHSEVRYDSEWADIMGPLATGGRLPKRNQWGVYSVNQLDANRGANSCEWVQEASGPRSRYALARNLYDWDLDRRTTSNEWRPVLALVND